MSWVSKGRSQTTNEGNEKGLPTHQLYGLHETYIIMLSKMYTCKMDRPY